MNAEECENMRSFLMEQVQLRNRNTTAELGCLCEAIIRRCNYRELMAFLFTLDRNKFWEMQQHEQFKADIKFIQDHSSNMDLT